jgi:hypothetical protein
LTLVAGMEVIVAEVWGKGKAEIGNVEKYQGKLLA